MKELTQDNLNEIIKTNKKVIVQYGATWCGMCKIIKPKFSKLSDDTPEVEFYYVDAEKFPQSRELAQIENLPTFASFSNGVLVKQAASSKVEAIQEVLNEITNH